MITLELTIKAMHAKDLPATNRNMLLLLAVRIEKGG